MSLRKKTLKSQAWKKPPTLSKRFSATNFLEFRFLPSLSSKYRTIHAHWGGRVEQGKTDSDRRLCSITYRSPTTYLVRPLWELVLGMWNRELTRLTECVKDKRHARAEDGHLIPWWVWERTIRKGLWRAVTSRKPGRKWVFQSHPIINDVWQLSSGSNWCSYFINFTTSAKASEVIRHWTPTWNFLHALFSHFCNQIFFLVFLLITVLVATEPQSTSHRVLATVAL